MAYFPKDSGTRLVQVRALRGDFPYYGSIETTPAKAGYSFRNGRKAVVDKTLMLQFNAEVGDSIKLGEVSFLIVGSLDKAPGQTGLTSSVAPIVFIPLQYLEQTGLTKTGSRINYNYYYKYDKPVDIKAVVDKIQPLLGKEGMNYDTNETQKENIGRFFSDLTRFLALGRFYCFAAGMCGSGEFHSCICTGKDQLDSYYALPGREGFTGIFNLSCSDNCNRIDRGR
jgi:putative ABC transport system permease protein